MFKLTSTSTPFSYSSDTICPTRAYTWALSYCSNHWELCGRDSLWCSGHTASGRDSDGSNKIKQERKSQKVRTLLSCTTYYTYAWYWLLSTILKALILYLPCPSLQEALCCSRCQHLSCSWCNTNGSQPLLWGGACVWAHWQERLQAVNEEHVRIVCHLIELCSVIYI